MTRAREDLVAVRVEPANRSRARLEAFWPGALLFADVDSAISLASPRRRRAPADAERPGVRRPAGFLARPRYPGRKAPEDLLASMRGVPAGRAGEAEARRTVVLGRCRHDGVPYDPALHGNLRRLQPAGGRHRTSHRSTLVSESTR